MNTKTLLTRIQRIYHVAWFFHRVYLSNRLEQKQVREKANFSSVTFLIRGYIYFLLTDLILLTIPMCVCVCVQVLLLVFFGISYLQCNISFTALP